MINIMNVDQEGKVEVLVLGFSLLVSGLLCLHLQTGCTIENTGPSSTTLRSRWRNSGGLTPRCQPRIGSRLDLVLVPWDVHWCKHIYYSLHLYTQLINIYFV